MTKEEAVGKIVEQGGDCQDVACSGCPLPCACCGYGSSASILFQAKKWLADNTEKEDMIKAKEITVKMDEEYEALKEKYAKDKRKLCEGYTPEQIRVILKTAPPLDTLEGYTLEYGKLIYVCDVWLSGKWIKSVGLLTPCGSVLMRIPIVEYLEDDEITDEHAKLRPPCECKDGGDDFKTGRTLIAVRDMADTWPFIVLRDDGRRIDTAAHCRIKKSDIK